jgi:predicted dienelactone hydrolase
MKIMLCRFIRQATLLLLGAFATAQAFAFDAGWRQISIPGSSADALITIVALYYPTQAQARAVPMGPFTLHVALQAPPETSVKGLIVLSHGTGGSELGHTTLAEGLAQHGYLVAALRHPGDNWQDHSLFQDSSERYFNDRPRQISRVIDALLADPDWKDRIARDVKGPRIGAVGHSAGGYSVLALAGGQPDLSRVVAHCASQRDDDRIFCSMRQRNQPTSTLLASPPSAATLIDRRVRAVVALVPVGVIFSAQSLAEIRIPTAIYEAERDRFLVPRFHAEWVRQNMPGAELHRVPNAWHFAFLDTPSMPIPSEDGDLGANPPGFDRQAFLEQLSSELPAFFDRTLQ